MPTPASFDPTTYNSATQEFTLGARYTYNGREFRYFQNAADGALADGDVVEQASATTYVVTQSTAASSLGRIPMGVACGTVTASYYFFALVDGIHTNVKGVTSTTIGMLQKTVAASAGMCTDNATASTPSLGISLATLSGPGRTTLMVRI